MTRYPDQQAIDQLLLENPLDERTFRRRLIAAQQGSVALRTMEMEAQRKFWEGQYRTALTACRTRIKDGSIKPYQLQSLVHAFTGWRVAEWNARYPHNRRQVPAAAE